MADSLNESPTQAQESNILSPLTAELSDEKSITPSFIEEFQSLVVDGGKKVDTVIARRNLHGCRQRWNEPASFYGLRVRTNVQKAYPSEENFSSEMQEKLSIDIFLANLRPQIKVALFRQPYPQTLQQAMNLALKEEQAFCYYQQMRANQQLFFENCWRQNYPIRMHQARQTRRYQPQQVDRSNRNPDHSTNKQTNSFNKNVNRNKKTKKFNQNFT
jgi:hypothetical protein|uniref:Gag protein n=1 Tax=Panagrolaimus sp. PS1159 TaxID=55785 RepID=A0AC35G4N0_9BILA